MRTSLNDIQLTEHFLKGALAPEEALLFEARLLTDPVLRLNLAIQKQVYRLIMLYQRKKLKEELEDIHHQLFHDPENRDFKQKIFQLFKH